MVDDGPAQLPGRSLFDSEFGVHGGGSLAAASEEGTTSDGGGTRGWLNLVRQARHVSGFEALGRPAWFTVSMAVTDRQRCGR